MSVRFVTLVFLVLSCGALRAQDLDCSVFGTQQNVRAESKSDLLGDIFITCEAADPGLPAAWETRQVNIIVNLSVNVTNNVDFGQGADVTDSRLIVNDVPQVYGVRTATREVAFDGVTIPFPGSFGNPSQTVIRITSIRGNVSQLGIAPEGGVIPIEAIVSTEPPSTLAVGVQAVTVGFSRVSLISERIDVIEGLNCADPESSAVADVTIREGYASAWKTQGHPSDAKNTFWESGYFANGSNNGAGASNPTMFRVSVSDVPEGVSIRVPNSITEAITFPWEAELIVTLDSEECGAPGSSPVPLDENGVGSAIYKVCSTESNRRERVTIPISVTWMPGQVGLGEAEVEVAYFPLGGSDIASLEDAEPRFADTGSPQTFLTLNSCETYLEFPLVTGRDGDATRVAVANSADPADPDDSHYCWVFHGGTDSSGGLVASAQRSDTVPAGQQMVFGPDFGAPDYGISGFPGFKGSLTLVCGFYPGDGTAEIRTGGRGKAESFVAVKSPYLRPFLFPRPLERTITFPYVTSADGSDTEVTLEHRIIGTRSLDDACELRYYGRNAPTPQALYGLPQGMDAVFKVSEGSLEWGIAPAPDFEGYVTASCDFTPSGFARIASSAKGGPKAPTLYGFGLLARTVDSGDGALDSRLLLPWASTRDGFSTELVITNTSLNPFGDVADDGVCELRYGPGILNPAPAPQVFPLGAGEQIRFDVAEGLASRSIAGAPGFEGKLSLLCDFPRASAVALSVKAGKGKSIETSIAQVAENAPNVTEPVPLVALTPVLYPGVVSGAEVDRGIVLSNNMGPEFGEVIDQNSCTLSFEGVMTDGSTPPSPAAFDMEPGETIRFLVSQGLASKSIPAAPGFDGFVKAACDFPLARGFDYRAPLDRKGP